MRAVAPLLLLLLPACAGPARSAPSDLHPSDVVELAALPPGYEAGESLSESCHGERGFRAITDEALGDVDCSVARLSRALRAHAAELASGAIVDKRCKQHGREQFTIHCSASAVAATPKSDRAGLARVEPRLPAPSPAQVLDLDEPDPRASAQIRVSFLPSAQVLRLAPRNYDRVAETAQPAVGRVPVGQVSARCASCDPRSLRHALRVTAGRLGAGEVATVRCFQEGTDQRCVGSALQPWSF